MLKSSDGVTLRMQRLPLSVTINLPSMSIARPVGRLNRAAAAAPSAGVTFRMQLLAQSLSKMVPGPSTATTQGMLERAAVPTPSVTPPPPPATVETVLCGETQRRWWFKVSVRAGCRR